MIDGGLLFFPVHYLYFSYWWSSFWSLALRAIGQQFFPRCGNQCLFLPSISRHPLFRKSKLSLSISSPDGESLKNKKLSIKDQFLTIYRNLRLVFLKGGQKNFGFMLCAVLLINALGGALGSIYNIFFLSHSLLDFSYTEALFISQVCALLAIIISSLTGNDFFGKQSLPRLMMWVTLGVSLVGLANLFNQVVLGLLFLF